MSNAAKKNEPRWIDLHGRRVDLENLPEGWVHIPGIYTGPDRRTNPTPMFSRYLLWGRRRKNVGKKAADKDFYVDRLNRQAWSVFWLTVLLSAIDAFFSVYYIFHHGYAELNPLLRPLIGTGSWAFVAGKFLLTFGGLLLLVLHQHFQAFKYVVTGVLFSYIVLCVYHVVILISH